MGPYSVCHFSQELHEWMQNFVSNKCPKPMKRHHSNAFRCAPTLSEAYINALARVLEHGRCDHMCSSLRRITQLAAYHTRPYLRVAGSSRSFSIMVSLTTDCLFGYALTRTRRTRRTISSIGRARMARSSVNSHNFGTSLRTSREPNSRQRKIAITST